MKKILLLLLLPFILYASELPLEKILQNDRAKAQKLAKDGNFKDAKNIYKRLISNENNLGKEAYADLTQFMHCLKELHNFKELDSQIKQFITLRSTDWRAHQTCAQLYSNIPHDGYILSGKFIRGYNYHERVTFVNSQQYDLISALSHFEKALALMQEKNIAITTNNFVHNFAQFLRRNNFPFSVLTNSANLPDLTQPHHQQHYPSNSYNDKAPVDSNGDPIFYQIPVTFQRARNNGERWRWLISKTSDQYHKRVYAEFLHNQFGVHTLQEYKFFFNRDANADKQSSILALEKISDRETIAKLANGIKKFSLPEEHNFISLYQQIDDHSANNMLATIYLNRRQFTKALAIYKRMKLKWPQHEKSQSKIEQIIGNWGEFSSCEEQPVGEHPTFTFRFRNAREVKFSATKVNMEKLIDDVREYLKSKPKNLDWQKIDLQNIGDRLIRRNETKYLTNETISWQEKLSPAEGHFTRRVTLKAPIAKAGVWLLKSTMTNGNESQTILHLNNATIIQKNLKYSSLFIFNNSIDGKPIANEKVHFFGYEHRYISNEADYRYKTFIKEMTFQTDAEGKIIIPISEANIKYNWLIFIKNDKYFTFKGFENIYHRNNRRQKEHSREKSYIITDRPVYKPGQKVEIKVWRSKLSYNPSEQTLFWPKQNIRITNPKGEKVFDATYKSDEFSGVSATYTIPENAPLGNYFIESHQGSIEFRVEEYKKPEFEVKIKAPQKAKALGELIPVVIQANYYYGASVAKGKVKIKVHRREAFDSWYPVYRWDWLYGNGYCWTGLNTPWYSGWEKWGCTAKRKSWIPWNKPRPELVIEQEAELNKDGSFTINIDSSIAKAIYGDKSQSYEITAEVTDESRRTIVGKASVIAAKAPFKVFVWNDRPFYNTNQTITSSFLARDANGIAVQGNAKIALFRISYDKNGQNSETLISQKNIVIDRENKQSIKLNASDSGQYRLVCKFTNSAGHTEEGAAIFTIYGPKTKSANFRYNDLELLTDKNHYSVGETVNLRINSNRENAHVYLFSRSEGSLRTRLQLVVLNGKSKTIPIKVLKGDQPNFFIEAIAVFNGKIHHITKQIFVPPAKKLLNIDITPNKRDYRPGEKATYNLKVTDLFGEPIKGSICLSIYDRSLDYISANSKTVPIYNYFWNWKRSLQPQISSNIEHYFRLYLHKNQKRMQQLGIYGNIGEEVQANEKSSSGIQMSKRKSLSSPRTSEGLLYLAKKEATPQPSGSEFKKPTIRQDFADLAYWNAIIQTNENGLAKVSFKMPENLTAWKARAWTIGPDFKVGEAQINVTTSKKLLLRLQAPRFFVENDEVVISANVHNYLTKDKTVRVRLQSNPLLEHLQEPQQTVSIKANGEARINWRMKAVGPGQVVLKAFALTDEESDAVQMKFPAKVHGILKVDSFSGFIPPDKTKSSLTVTLPENLDPEQTQLELRYSPTLAGAMIDALPYLTSFPYGCTEQTLNRFLPTTITRKILADMNINLKDIEEKITNLNAQEIGQDQARAKRWQHANPNFNSSRYQGPIFDQKLIAKMEKQGLEKLQNMQLSDGGWGWFSGYREKSSAHTTATVLRGLIIARDNGSRVDKNSLTRGLDWLQNYQKKEMQKIRDFDNGTKNVPQKQYADNLDALVLAVLSDADRHNAEMFNTLYEDRNQLSTYAKCLLALTSHKLKQTDKTATLKRNIEQFLKVDRENQTAYLDLNNNSYWYSWYGSEYEAHAYYLKLLCKIEPQGSTAPMLVKYLLNNRRNATYWNSTRDTALIIEAFADYLRASKEMAPAMTLDIIVDGKKVKEVKIDKENLFTFDNKLILDNDSLKSGDHKIEIHRRGQGPVYFNTYLTYFSKEEYIKKAGLEVKVRRKFYKLIRQKDHILETDKTGKVVKSNQEAYKRIELKDLATVTSGDLIEVELEVESKNNYEYIVIEDLKAAGFEATNIRSGYRRTGSFWAYQEMRNDRIAFLISQLPRGTHNLSYRLRAEIPGKFSALPAKVYGNYAPELKGNSNEIKFNIVD